MPYVTNWEKYLPNIGRFLKELRKSKGLTQKELAKKLDVTQGMISQFESESSNISMKSVEKILNAMDENMEDFLQYVYLYTLEKSINDTNIITKDNFDQQDIPEEIVVPATPKWQPDLQRFASPEPQKKDLSTTEQDLMDKLLDNFKTVNTEGKNKIVDYSNDLADNPRYKKEDNVPQLSTEKEDNVPKMSSGMSLECPRHKKGPI